MRATVLAVALALASAACTRDAPAPKPLPPDRAEAILHERIWLDHAPTSPTDRFQLALFDRAGSGVLQRRTVWKGDFELFFYEADDGELAFQLPGSGASARSSFRVVRVAGPDRADHKLIIDHPPTGPREYWGWRLDGHADADTWLAQRFATRAPRR